MHIQIENWNSPYNKRPFICANYWISPDSQYILIERYRSELFVFAKVLNKSEDKIVCLFMESYFTPYQSVDLRLYDVDWSYMPLGFCKLLRTEFESGFFGTDRRFYIQRNRKE